MKNSALAPGAGGENNFIWSGLTSAATYLLPLAVFAALRRGKAQVSESTAYSFPYAFKKSSRLMPD